MLIEYGIQRHENCDECLKPIEIGRGFIVILPFVYLCDECFKALRRAVSPLNVLVTTGKDTR